MLLMSFLQLVSRACETGQDVAMHLGKTTYDLIKFTVLHHHRVDDPQEALIRREKASASSKCVSLQHTLAGMFGQDLDDPAATSI